MGEDWTPKKLDVSVDMPLELDLSSLKATGLQPDEIEFPPDTITEPAAPPKVSIDESVVTQLVEMGFHQNACRRAVISSGNAGAETAMNWLMQHMDDADINDPVNLGAGSGHFVANEEAVAAIQNMGFTAPQAKLALQNTDNNVERAVDWIFSHTAEIANVQEGSENANCVTAMETGDNKANPDVTDGPASMSLCQFHYFPNVRLIK